MKREPILPPEDRIEGLNVTSVTLVGYSPTEFPATGGNCFSLEVAGNKDYRIVNFNYENLKELLNRGLTWPIMIKPLSERVAVVHDERIPSQWYDSRWCTVCCPNNLLPLPQQLDIEQDVRFGVIEKFEHCHSYSQEKAYERKHAFDPDALSFEEHIEKQREALSKWSVEIVDDLSSEMGEDVPQILSEMIVVSGGGANNEDYRKEKE